MRDTTIKHFIEIQSKTCEDCKYACSLQTQLACMEAFIKYASTKSTHSEIIKSVKSGFSDEDYTAAENSEGAYENSN